MQRQAIRLYLDGNNQQRIARQIGVSQGSASNWVRAFSDSLPDKLPQPEQPVEVTEIDELFTLISDKETMRHDYRRPLQLLLPRLMCGPGSDSSHSPGNGL